MPDNNLSDSDLDLVARTIATEAGTDPLGQMAVGTTIRNRQQAGGYGNSIGQIVRPSQFEVWANGKAQSVDPNSPAYQSAMNIAKAVFAGNAPDPTGGATHFYSPSGQAALAGDGRQLTPSWAKNKPLANIGGQLYYAPNGPVQSQAPAQQAISDATSQNVGTTPVVKTADDSDDVISSLGLDTSKFDKPSAKTVETAPAPQGDDVIKSLGLDTSKFDQPTAKPATQTPAPQTTPSVPTPNMLPTSGGDQSAAVGRGILNGIPIVGPYFLGGANRLAAGVRSLQNDTKFSDELNNVNAFSNATAANNPGSTTAGQVGGALGGYAALGATGLGAKALGGVGSNLLMRGATAIPANALLGGADAAVRSGGDPTQTAVGTALGGLGGVAGPVVGAGAEYAGSALKGIVEPFTASGQSDIANRVINKFAQGGNTAADATEHVPGSVPTLAQATANPGLAAAERVMRDMRPNMFGDRDAVNTLARNNVMGALKGDANSLDNLVQMRQEASDPIREAAFDGAGSADASNAVDYIDSTLASPAGQRDSVVKALGNIRKKLVLQDAVPQSTNPDGSLNAAKPAVLQDNPAQLYGIRQAIGDLMSPLNGATESSPRLASKELGGLKDALDSSIEDAAPGFGDYLKTFSGMSKPINEQTFLQNANTTDVKGNTQLGPVNRLIQNIQKGQRAGGINAAKDISPDTMNALTGVYKDLNRAGNSALGKSIGSNTFQNLATANVMNRIGLPAMAFDALNANPKMAVISYLAKKAYSGQNDAILDALSQKLLNPTHSIGTTNPLASSPYGALGSGVVQKIAASPIFAGSGLSVNSLLGSPKSNTK